MEGFCRQKEGGTKTFREWICGRQLDRQEQSKDNGPGTEGHTRAENLDA